MQHILNELITIVTTSFRISFWQIAIFRGCFERSNKLGETIN